MGGLKRSQKYSLKTFIFNFGLVLKSKSNPKSVRENGQHIYYSFLHFMFLSHYTKSIANVLGIGFPGVVL